MVSAIFFIFACELKGKEGENAKPKIPFGGPFILLHENKYYAYGTHGDDGIEVYVSDDLYIWRGPVGAKNCLALRKDDVWADRWFWAPEIYLVNGKFYMYYSADEQIYVATSDSPLGPFTQKVKKPMINNKICWRK